MNSLKANLMTQFGNSVILSGVLPFLFSFLKFSTLTLLVCILNCIQATCSNLNWFFFFFFGSLSHKVHVVGTLSPRPRVSDGADGTPIPAK